VTCYNVSSQWTVLTSTKGGLLLTASVV
jgi:hypothetical protein